VALMSNNMTTPH